MLTNGIDAPGPFFYILLSRVWFLLQLQGVPLRQQLQVPHQTRQSTRTIKDLLFQCLNNFPRSAWAHLSSPSHWPKLGHMFNREAVPDNWKGTILTEQNWDFANKVREGKNTCRGDNQPAAKVTYELKTPSLLWYYPRFKTQPVSQLLGATPLPKPEWVHSPRHRALSVSTSFGTHCMLLKSLFFYIFKNYASYTCSWENFQKCTNKNHS